MRNKLIRFVDAYCSFESKFTAKNSIYLKDAFFCAMKDRNMKIKSLLRMHRVVNQSKRRLKSDVLGILQLRDKMLRVSNFFAENLSLLIKNRIS